MREIKFRGYHEFHGEKERISSEWVYGYYFKHPEADRHSIFLSDGGGSRIVDKESVGQYTGLKDKNGVEIYEGDVISYCQHLFNTHPERYPVKIKEVKWVDGLAKWNIYETNAGESNIHVIGNIYQNPELIKSGVIPALL